MEQKDLRTWEARCTQEEPPKCKARCPLHVDGRELCKMLAADQVDKAWAVLCKTLPFPSVSARICDGICQKDCLRQEVGGGIELAALERFCAENAKRTPPLRALPAKGKKIAVFGANLPGLAAAWDLGKKGFIVTIFCSHKFEGFDALPEGRVEKEFFEQELAQMSKMNISIEEESGVQVEDVFTALYNFDAVFVDPCALDAQKLGLKSVDPTTLKTERDFLFASSDMAGKSPVHLIAAGRKGALSIERALQNASLTAGRDREDPFETKLFTNISKAISVPPVSVPAQGYSAEQAREEAARCLLCECMECVNNCAYLKEFKSYPKAYARQIYNNASIVMGTRQANKLINSCMLCGLCEEVCPENFAMQDLCIEARQDLVKKGHMPQSAHEFAFRDMEFADSSACALIRHQPGHAASSQAFFPGCQLGASDPGAVERAYASLCDTLEGGTGLMLRCCAAPADWAGQQEMFDRKSKAIVQDWESLGKPRIIAACPSCMESLAKALPEAEIIYLWSVFSKKLVNGDSTCKGTLSLQDPCTARHNQVLMNDVRLLLAGNDISFNEPELSGRLTECCGFGGLLANANEPLSAKVAEKRAEKLSDDGVTYCAMCRDLLAKAGKRCLHLLDLLLPSGHEDPAARPAPGYSERRENRVRLKETLLENLWQEKGAPRPGYESVCVEFTPEATTMLEERRIMISDVQKTLLAAEGSGRFMTNADTGHRLTSHRPTVVTYWVEYEQKGETYLVHRVWSHRMHILGGVS
ncbi:pyridine nucleotide-disulfide oxidoreductase/dicluster-binding protein [Maridesulfovibrio sp. FT414]|uniref:pyridine nucleotide-disulfide oxidoreductase/dicluster-binding protein n=1 Tax=Maridesulfovibrio sp. FT414 TaxID=2979469 RepID=UPI003D8049CC